MSIPQSYFVETTVPDGTTGRVLRLENLSGRALILPVELPHDEAYAFSVWVKASAAGSLRIDLLGTAQTVSVGTVWQRITMVTDSRETDEVRLTPMTDAQYYIYRAMLETGNKPGDWSPSPEDGTKEVHNSSVTIDTTGITMESTGALRFLAGGATAMLLDADGIAMNGGHIDIQAGASFRVRSGGVFQVESDGQTQTDNYINFGNKFVVSEDGALTCAQATVDEMKVDGYDPWTRKNLIVSSGEPGSASRPCIWLKPNGTTVVNYEGTSGNIYGSGNVTLPKISSGDLSGVSGPYTYTLTFPVGNESSGTIRGISVSATLSGNGYSLSGFSVSGISRDAKSSYSETVTLVSPVNLCQGAGAITAAFSIRGPSGAYMHVPKVTLVVSTENQVEGSVPCEVRWCP